MEDYATRSAHIARVISRVTNPGILSVIILLSIAYTESSSVHILASSVAVVLVFLVILPLFFVYMRTSRGRNRMENLTIILKQHPRDILILGLLLGLPCLVILIFLKAPTLLLYTLGILLVGSTVIALFNIFYRVSYHLAAFIILVIMAALVWGEILLIFLATIPLLGWAKYQVREHTVAQLTTGVALSMAITGATWYLLIR
ncbi:hypothetical protein ACFLTP_01555 [Chloroflexota bacterium]